MQIQQNSQGYRRLKDVVDSYCKKIGDVTLSRWDVYMEHALCGLREWNFDTAQSVVSRDFQVNDLCYVPFPIDYVNWQKIGIRHKDRIDVLLVQNDILLTKLKDDCGDPVNNQYQLPDTGALIPTWPFFNYWGITTAPYTMYGFGNGGRSIGDFRIDDKLRQIWFTSDLANKWIVMEYITTGISPSGESVVNEQAALLVEYWINYQRSLFEESQKRMQPIYEREYNKQKLISAQRIFDFDIQKLYAITLDMFKLTPKTDLY